MKKFKFVPQNPLLTHKVKGFKALNSLVTVDFQTDVFRDTMNRLYKNIDKTVNSNEVAEELGSTLMFLSHDLIPYRDEYRLKKDRIGKRIAPQEQIEEVAKGLPQTTKRLVDVETRSQLFEKDSRVRAGLLDKNVRLKKKNKYDPEKSKWQYSQSLRYDDERNTVSVTGNIHHASSSQKGLFGTERTTTYGKEMYGGSYKERNVTINKDSQFKAFNYKGSVMSDVQPPYSERLNRADKILTSGQISDAKTIMRPDASGKKYSPYYSLQGHIARYPEGTYYDPVTGNYVREQNVYTKVYSRRFKNGKLRKKPKLIGKRKIGTKTVKASEKLYGDRPPHLNESGELSIKKGRTGALAQISYSVHKSTSDMFYGDKSGNDYAYAQYYGIIKRIGKDGNPDYVEQTGDIKWKRFTPDTTSRWLEVAIGLKPNNVKGGISASEAKRNYQELIDIISKRIKGGK